MSKGKVEVAAFNLSLGFATNILSRLVARFPGNILCYSYEERLQYEAEEDCTVRAAKLESLLNQSFHSNKN